MTEQVESIILEHLKAMRVDIAGIRQRLDDLIERMASLETHVGQLIGDLLRHDSRFDRLEARIARIERRLELQS